MISVNTSIQFVLNFVLFFRKLKFSKIDLNQLQKITKIVFFLIFKSVKSYWWNIGNLNQFIFKILQVKNKYQPSFLQLGYL